MSTAPQPAPDLRRLRSRSLAEAGPVYPAWARRRDVTITLFLWVVLAAATIWAAFYIIRPVLIVVLAALLAYAVTPLVRRLARLIPLPIAIALVYLVLVGLVGGVGYLFVSNAVTELSALTNQVTHLLTPARPGAPRCGGRVGCAASVRGFTRCSSPGCEARSAMRLQTTIRVAVHASAGGHESYRRDRGVLPWYA